MSSPDLSKEQSYGSSYSGGIQRKLNRIDLTDSSNLINTTTNEEDPIFSNFDEDYTVRSGKLGASAEDDKDEGFQDEDQLPMQDKIDSIKPVLDHQDKLWKQIDILDDVKKMSVEIMKNGTFFNPTHATLLDELRNSQLSLLGQLNKLEKSMDESIYHEIWDLNLDADTLDDEIDTVKHKLFNKEQFGKISDSIDEIKSSLNELKENIKTVDDSSRDMWDNNDFSNID